MTNYKRIVSFVLIILAIILLCFRDDDGTRTLLDQANKILKFVITGQGIILFLKLYPRNKP